MNEKIKSVKTNKLKTMKYTFFSDPGHGWLKVPIEHIKQLGIESQITCFSYVSNNDKYAYLEEDVDANIFVKAAMREGWIEDINKSVRQSETNSESFIIKLNIYKKENYIE
ncbi:hypothetical protein [uncultured Draconibacterium sp.]|uniref:hypothetical protein n=1 Tax=uncultured Draconibacterium sp. TaxID=1573823 RepID=UPI0025DB5D3E|nr:hypothetical protein [uncultured Draconibacterium sp.]